MITIYELVSLWDQSDFQIKDHLIIMSMGVEILLLTKFMILIYDL